MRKLILFFLVSLTCSGCFTRWVMTDRQVRAYYKHRPIKPVYFTIHHDTANLFCATTGADTLPPLLLIHGAPGSWSSNRNMMEDSALLKHYHIIAVDRPGYHKSWVNHQHRAVTAIETQAIVIHEALRLNRSFKPGVVLGSSYGGPIAAKIAMMYPNEFKHLVMLAPSIDPEKEKFWWFNPYIRYGFGRWLLPRFVNRATDEKFAHVAELEKLKTGWSSLKVPVTVVQGGADDIVDPANLDFAKRQLRGKKAEFVFLPNAGHLIRLQYPQVVRNILLKASAE